jgi:hypothetical protein
MFGFGLKLQLASAFIAVALVAAGCGLMAPRADKYPQPRTGTTWTNMNRDTGSYGSGTSQISGRFVANRTWQGSEVHAFEFGGITTLMTQGNANFIVQLKGDAPVVTWDPPAGWVWPLEVGKTWTRKSRVTLHAAKRTIETEYTGTVEAHEEITVPAGTFKTFRIKTVNSSGDENVFWFSPEAGIHMKQSLRRTAKHPQGPGTREIEVVSYTPAR